MKKMKSQIPWVAFFLVGAIILAFILSGCKSAQWHLAKALEKDPTIIVNDSIREVDTVWNEIPVIDTVFKETYDTIEFIKEETKIRYFRDTVTNEVFIEVDCPDCPEITNTVTVTKTIIQEPNWLIQTKKKSKWIIIIVIAAVVIGVILKILK